MLALNRMARLVIQVPRAGGRRRRRKPWYRRRPVNRFMVVTHRWISLLLGLILLVITTSGAILLFKPEYFRITHSSLYHHTASAHPIGPETAVAAVTERDPDFTPSWVLLDHDVYLVGNSDYNGIYGVDPGTGQINTLAHRNGGGMGLLENLHECGLSCAGYPAYLSFMQDPIPTLGISWLNDITWASFVLGLFGLILLFLGVSGLITWWPGIRRLGSGFAIRMRRGRFARDYDLHKVVGTIAVPFLLMWGLTGAAFEFPAVETAWLTITGGSAVPADQYNFTPSVAVRDAPTLTMSQVAAIAKARVPGEVVQFDLPTEDTPYYAVSIKQHLDPYAHSQFPGGGYVYVDAHDPNNVKVALGAHESVANTVYNRVLEPSHFGWQVNGWWRILWFIFGLSPLLLAVTGVSTWLIRNRTNRNRRQRNRARRRLAGGARPEGATESESRRPSTSQATG